MPTVPRNLAIIPAPPHFAFPNLVPAGRIPANFELWPDVRSITLPVTPTIPPVVASGDLITASHENAVRQALNDLWIDVQALGTAAINDPTTAKGQIVVRGASAIEAMPAGVNGQVLVADSTQAQGLRWANSGSLQTPWLQHIDGGGFNLSNVAQITTTGNIGIGTSSPQSILEVSSATAGGRTNVTLMNPAAPDYANRIRLRLGPSSGFVNSDLHAYVEAFCEEPSNQATGLAFGTYLNSLAERMRITAAGNVGIGTAGPQFAFVVRSAGNVAAIFGNTSGAIGAGQIGGVPIIQGYVNDTGTGGTNLCLQPSFGNVGIGTQAPDTALVVKGTPNNNVGIMKVLTTAGNNAGISLMATGGTMANWQISSNYSAAGNLDFLVSAVPTSDPTQSRFQLLSNGGIVAPLLPAANPGAGSKQFWYDPADGNRVKFAP